MKKSQNSKTIKYLMLCMLVAGLLCVAQISGNSILILGVLLLQLAITLFGAFQGLASPVLLFFLPWSTVIKLAPGSISFYTISLIGVCFAYLVRLRLRLNMRCVIIAIFLLGTTLLGKLLVGGGMALSYVMFFCLLVMFPPVMEELSGGVDFQRLTVFFSMGIISAALSARLLIPFENIARYIDVDSWANVVRYSGFYGDANFYAAHISASLSGVLLVILKEKQLKNLAAWLLLAVTLLYCGLMSASKAFVLTMGLVFCIWVAAVLSVRGKLGTKIGIILGLLGAVIVIARTGIFSDMINVILYRFSASEDMSGLTTGRLELWMNYGKRLLESPKMLFFGCGYTNLKVDGRASHNTLIQMIFQFGLLGAPLLLCWLWSYMEGVLRGRRVNILLGLIMLLGAFLPWMALDLLFFDEFFLIPLYVVSAIVFLNRERSGGATASLEGKG